MTPNLFKVSNVGNGLLYVMPKPSAEWLLDDVTYFHSKGITKVVSLLQAGEEYELGLSKERELCEAAGIQFSSFPIEDRGLPSINPFKKWVTDLYAELQSGEHITLHCRAGIGRTGLLAACLLIKDGYAAQVAIDQVSAARGVSIPDTQAQYDFICDYASIGLVDGA